jgi:hypothetical protein
MLYLKRALGGLGRSVTDTARLALAQAGSEGRVAFWRKVAVYAAVFALPGGSIAVLVYLWASRRRAQRKSAADVAAVPASQASSVHVTPCANAQPACRAARPSPRKASVTLAGAQAREALNALRRSLRNDV